MSLTIIGFSLCGAFAGAAGGLFLVYPDGSPKKYATIGALIGAVALGGGAALSRSEDELSAIKGIFIEADKPSPLSSNDCLTNKPAGSAVASATMQPDGSLACTYRPE